MNNLYAYSFDAKKYKDNSFKDLKKLPLDTYNNLLSAISRFNDVRTPDGQIPDEKTKEVAWNNIVRSSQLLEVELPVDNWKDLEKYKYFKNIKREDNEILNAVIFDIPEEYKFTCVISSNMPDVYNSSLTNECLENLKDQINNRTYKIRLQTSHFSEWDTTIGHITNARIIIMESFPSAKFDTTFKVLMVDVILDKEHPLSEYLYKQVKRKFEKKENKLTNKNDSIGFSIGGQVEKFYYIDDSDKKIYPDPMEFKLYQTMLERIYVEKIHLDHVAVTNRPANLDSYLVDKNGELLMSINRSVPSNPKSKLDADSPWSFSAEDGNRIIEKGGMSLYAKCHAYKDDSKDPENKGSYKLPHHKLDSNGNMTLYWSGVKAAMGALLGARGGVNIPADEKEKVYKHLAAHYKQFDKEPPEFKRSLGGNGMENNEDKKVVVENTPTKETTSDDVVERQEDKVKEQNTIEQTENQETNTIERTEKTEETKKEVNVEVKIENSNDEIKRSLEELKTTLESLPTAKEDTQIDLSEYVKKSDVEELVGQIITRSLENTLNEFELMKKNILVLNESLTKIARCLQSNPEDQTNKIVRTQEEKKEEKETKSALDILSEKFLQDLKNRS